MKYRKSGGAWSFLAGVKSPSALFTIPAYVAVWAMPHTSSDLLLYCLFAVGLALGAMLASLRRALRRPTKGVRVLLPAAKQ